MNGPNWIYFEWAAYIVLGALALAVLLVIAGLIIGGAYIFLKYFFAQLFGFGKITSGPLGIVSKKKKRQSPEKIND